MLVIIGQYKYNKMMKKKLLKNRDRLVDIELFKINQLVLKSIKWRKKVAIKNKIVL